MNVPTGREVVITRATVTAVVGLIVSLAAIFGLPIDPATQAHLVEVLFVLSTVVLPLAAGLWARKDVTPVADPKTKGGTPLVPVTEVGAGDEDENAPVPPLSSDLTYPEV